MMVLTNATLINLIYKREKDLTAFISKIILKSDLYMRSVQKVSSHVLWKIETVIEEGTR